MDEVTIRNPTKRKGTMFESRVPIKVEVSNFLTLILALIITVSISICVYTYFPFSSQSDEYGRHEENLKILIALEERIVKEGDMSKFEKSREKRDVVCSKAQAFLAEKSGFDKPPGLSLLLDTENIIYNKYFVLTKK